MSHIEIAEGIELVGVDDIESELFENLWPVADGGVSINSYLVKGETVALIDTAPEAKAHELLANLERSLGGKPLGHIVLNHVEPDHSGALRAVTVAHPGAKIHCTKKAAELLNLYGIRESGCNEVKEGDTLDLGGRRLRFLVYPFVHWPDTMMTFEENTGALFSCDAFGAFGALRGKVSDEEIPDTAKLEREALRYFSNVMVSYPKPVLKAAARAKELPLKAVAPSHGPIWKRDPMKVIGLYEGWAASTENPAGNGITVIFGSMYGTTARVAHAVADGLASAGAQFELFDASRSHDSHILASLCSKRGVIVGSPTYDAGLFPPVARALMTARRKGLSNRVAAFFGGCGWGANPRKEFNEMAEALKWSVRDGFDFKGAANEDVLTRARAFGKAFAEGL